MTFNIWKNHFFLTDWKNNVSVSLASDYFVRVENRIYVCTDIYWYISQPF